MLVWQISKVAASETDGEPPLDEKQTIAALRLCMKSTREAVVRVTSGLWQRTLC